jgi:hypothetical protein
MAPVGVRALSEPKPLHWSFFVTAGVALCAIWAVVYTFAQLERARFVDELEQQIAQGKERDATQALRKLAQLRDPPLEVFVVAATAPSREVALQAQELIADMLRSWRHDAKSSRGASRVASRLERLAAALDAQRGRMTSLDVRWIDRTTDQMLQLADAAPPEEFVSFSMRCESLLAFSRSYELEPRSNVMPVATAVDTSPADLFAPPSRVALQSILGMEMPTVLDELNLPPELPPRLLLPSLVPNQSAAPMPRPFQQPSDNAATPVAPVSESEETSDADMSPASPTQVESRVLLERWLVQTGSHQLEIERELQRRGFGNLRSDIVRLGLTGDRGARVQLVHDLPAIRGLGARAWLMLLAEDDDPEVRQAAVGVMATSRDAELLERAWNVAVHDRDPRVAELAKQMRHRQSTAGLR